MTTQPLFSIKKELSEDFNYENPENPVLKEIRREFENKFKPDKNRMRIKKFLKNIFKPEGKENLVVVLEKERERWAIKYKRKKWFQIIKTDKGFDVYKGKSRQYASTIIPTLSSYNKENTEKLLLDLYKEVCSNWKMLTDVRFKLLGFVPAISVLAWGQLLSADIFKTLTGSYAGILIAFIGMLNTIALRIYDKRNDSLYDDLISRGRKIEEELGVDTAIFRGRVNPPKSWINHSIPVKIIYNTVIVGWLSTAIWFILVAFKVLNFETMIIVK